MRFRAAIMMFVLLAQPVTALAGALGNAGAVSPADGGVSHCDSAPSNASTASGVPADSEHTDCATECGLCAACAASLPPAAIRTADVGPAIDTLFYAGTSPPGIAAHPYRPPILY